MPRRVRLVWPAGTAWSIFESGSFTPTQRVYNLPGSAAPGSVTVSSGSLARTTDGTSFVVKADGVTKLTTGCINDGGMSCAIPANTIQITVDVVNNCLSGAGAAWTISGGGG